MTTVRREPPVSHNPAQRQLDKLEMEEDENALRQAEELAALEAFYGDHVTTTKDGEGWKIQIGSGIDLEIRLPSQYPLEEGPTPKIQAPAFCVSPSVLHALEADLTSMYQPDTEVAILWAEHVRATLVPEDAHNDHHADETPHNTLEVLETNHQTEETIESSSSLLVFYPYGGSKYGQPIRKFDASVVHNPENAVPIYQGKPFHPPKSGASETMLAHVAPVTSMDQVQWVLAKLLLEDSKVAKATHNMIAYRFQVGSDGRIADHDDDGEKGAGTKLASLLELAGCENTLVVVSRWYGGIHLGSARFKHIASTARTALEDAGLLPLK